MIQRKAQTHNNGNVRIYAVSDSSESGDMPKDLLTLKQSLRYQERTVGLTRYYAALQANVNVSLVLRCPMLRDVSTQDIAVPNDGKQYAIRQIQYPENIAPPVMDLTLERVEQDYALA
ncbi:MAG: hypothetical protein E7476_07650 [Ruminococcaceae bacterium]|nr:hypothetical protein [Oscillospiraceae bacterium]